MKDIFILSASNKMENEFVMRFDNYHDVETAINAIHKVNQKLSEELKFKVSVKKDQCADSITEL